MAGETWQNAAKCGGSKSDQTKKKCVTSEHSQKEFAFFLLLVRCVWSSDKRSKSKTNRELFHQLSLSFLPS